MENATLFILVPCFNEQEVLPKSSGVFAEKLNALKLCGKISEKSRIVFIDDGSRDGTWEIISSLAECQKETFRGIKLSRNFGHQNALLAGLSTVADECDVTVTVDADLQDDINAVDMMLDAYFEGNEVVYGVRESRETDTFFKRKTAEGFYRFMRLMGAETVYNHADFRLLSACATKKLLEFKEVNLFLRGMVPLVGFKTCCVTYKRGTRAAGESKYPLKKMLSFALDGITSFSAKPIRFITAFGFILLVLCVVFAVYTLIRHFTGNTVSGWTSTVLSIWFFGSCQLLAIGVIGEYIAKIFTEVKHRPRFIVEQYLK